MRSILIIICSVLVIAVTRGARADTANGVGMILPLSGPLAEFGVAMRNGVELAQRDHPAASCHFLFEDSAYAPKTAVSAFRKLADVEKLKILYSFGGPVTTALVPLTKGRDLILFSGETEPNLSIGYDNVIRFNVPSEALAKAQVDGLVRSGYRKVGMIIVDNEYFNSIEREIRKALPAEITIEEVARLQPRMTDLSSVVAKLRQKQFDVVGIALFGDIIPIFYREMQRQSLSIPTFSLQSLENDALLKQSGSKISDATFASTLVDESFSRRYQETFASRDQVIWAGFSFDFASLVLRDLCPIGKSSAADMLSKLRNSARVGVSGDFRFVQAPSGDKFFSFPVVLRQVLGNGSIVSIEDNK